METYKSTNDRSKKMYNGLVLLVIGLIFLLGNFEASLPQWIFSWHTLLIVIGLMMGFRRNFNVGGWLIMVLAGVFFTLADIAGLNFFRYYLAMGPIIMGSYLILKYGGFSKTGWKKEELDFNKKTF